MSLPTEPGLWAQGRLSGDDGGGFGEAEAFHEGVSEFGTELFDEGDGEGFAAGEADAYGFEGFGISGFGVGHDGVHGGDA